jgi:hypothetical protein
MTLAFLQCASDTGPRGWRPIFPTEDWPGLLVKELLPQLDRWSTKPDGVLIHMAEGCDPPPPGVDPQYRFDARLQLRTQFPAIYDDWEGYTYFLRALHMRYGRVIVYKGGCGTVPEAMRPSAEKFKQWVRQCMAGEFEAIRRGVPLELMLDASWASDGDSLDGRVASHCLATGFQRAMCETWPQTTTGSVWTGPKGGCGGIYPVLVQQEHDTRNYKRTQIQGPVIAMCLATTTEQMRADANAARERGWEVALPHWVTP